MLKTALAALFFLGCGTNETGSEIKLIASGATWVDPNTNLVGYAGQAIPILGDALVVLPLPDGARLYSVAAYVHPQGKHTALPKRMPRLYVYRTDIEGSARVDLRDAPDETPLSVYETNHAIVVDFDEPLIIDAQSSTYVALIESEGEENAQPLPFWGVISEIEQ